MHTLKDNYIRTSGFGETWTVQFDPPKRKVKTYFEESVEIMEYLHTTKTGKFQVLCSGGLDSQYMCNILLKLGMDFVAVIISLESNTGVVYNHHDIKHAYEYCKCNNITVKTYSLNFDKFVDSGKILEIAEVAGSCSPSVPACLHVASQLDGFSMIGQDPAYLRLNKQNGLWELVERELDHSLLRFYNKNNLNGCTYFNMYSAEMMLSFLLDPSILELGMGKLPGKTGSNSTKNMVYNNGSGFNMPPYIYREPYNISNSWVKFTGYESIIYNDKITNHPNWKAFENPPFSEWNGAYHEPYTDIVKRLSVNQ